MEYKDALDNLLEGIKLDYYNWTKPSRVEGNLLKIKLESIDRFNESLNIKVGRKFDKVIEKGRVWGFVAKTDGVHKGIPHKKGDVFKAAGWTLIVIGILGQVQIICKKCLTYIIIL